MYEIDFLPVGEGEKGGDAISFRYSSDGENWFVGVIDGGSKASGQALCEHIQEFYGTNVVNIAISTHPDADHASGLVEVIENLEVRQLLMHRPWEHVNEIFPLVSDGRITPESLRTRLIEGFPFAWELEGKAQEKGVELLEPFSGEIDSSIIHILSPPREFYLRQLLNFRPITEITSDVDIGSTGGFSMLGELARRAIRWIAETWDSETLVDPADDATSAENNSSVVMMLNYDEKLSLFTGDAGVPALSQAVIKLVELGHQESTFKFVQIPHHGSKRNVGPTLLNGLIGNPVPFGSAPYFTAIVSAPKENNSKHPSKRVVNAFIRRGAKVVTTQGKPIQHFHETPNRGWSPAAPQPFYSQVEEDEG